MTKEETRRGAESVAGPSKKRKRDGSAGGDWKGKRKVGEVGEEELEWRERVEERLEGIEERLKVIALLMGQAVKMMDQRWPEVDEEDDEEEGQKGGEDTEDADEVAKAATGRDEMELD